MVGRRGRQVSCGSFVVRDTGREGAEKSDSSAFTLVSDKIRATVQETESCGMVRVIFAVNALLEFLAIGLSDFQITWTVLL